MREKQIEKKLREGVMKAGGLALKFVSPAFSGVPDRIVLMPQGSIWFVETKAPGKPLKPRQQVVFSMLQGLGFKALKIDSEQQVQEFLNMITK